MNTPKMNVPEEPEQNRINNLKALIGLEGSVALDLLFALKFLKKHQRNLIDIMIEDQWKKVHKSMVDCLLVKVKEESLLNFLKAPVVPWTEDQEPMVLIDALMYSCTHFRVDWKNRPYTQIGGGSAKVYAKDLIPGCCISLKDAQDKCQELSELWGGLATISCNVFGGSLDQISFALDKTNFVIEQAVAQ